MNTLGKVCLGLTLVAVLAGIYLGGRLGNTSNTWAVKLRDARIASEKAVADNARTLLDLKTAQAELARVKLGWGFEWVFPPGGNVGNVQVVGRNLAVTGLGTSAGLAPRQIEINEQPTMVMPSVHVFALDGQGGSVYIGEFLPDAQQLAEASSVLVPTWEVTAQEIAGWNFSGGIRMRSQVPPAGRAAVEGANQKIRRLRELFAETQASITEQQQLLTAAQQQLATRKGELLGNPNIPLIADRPEYTAGLVQALEDLEEERNSVQLAVDGLRRAIKTEAEARSSLVNELNQVVQQLPAPQSQLSQREQ